MGRTASHITLEVALQTHPNVALIGEEVQARGQSLSAVVRGISDIIATRALQGKHYGCVILPEGLVDFLPDVGVLLAELNELMAMHKTLPANVTAHLTQASASLFASLPGPIAQQLLMDRLELIRMHRPLDATRRCMHWLVRIVACTGCCSRAMHSPCSRCAICFSRAVSVCCC
jgi:hypothetical protein